MLLQGVEGEGCPIRGRRGGASSHLHALYLYHSGAVGVTVTDLPVDGDCRVVESFVRWDQAARRGQRAKSSRSVLRACAHLKLSVAGIADAGLTFSRTRRT